MYKIILIFFLLMVILLTLLGPITLLVVGFHSLFTTTLVVQLQVVLIEESIPPCLPVRAQVPLFPSTLLPLEAALL